MSTNQIRGVITKIHPTNTVTDKFSNRKVRLSVQDGNFTQEPEIEFQNRATRYLDNFTEGQEVEIEFSLKGRAGTNGKHYTSAVGYKIVSVGDNGNSY